MREACWAISIFCAAATPVVAQPAGLVGLDASPSEDAFPHLRTSDARIYRKLAPDADARRFQRDEDRPEFSPSPDTLSLGPFRMDIGSAARMGDRRTAHFAHVHLEDVRVLGGDVSGTFDGRAATIHLSWPTSN